MELLFQFVRSVDKNTDAFKGHSKLLGPRKMWVPCSDPSVRLESNGQVHFTVPRCDTFTKHTPTIHLDMIYWCHAVVCVLDLHFKLQWPWLGRNGQVYITAEITKVIRPDISGKMKNWSGIGKINQDARPVVWWKLWKKCLFISH